MASSRISDLGNDDPFASGDDLSNDIAMDADGGPANVQSDLGIGDDIGDHQDEDNDEASLANDDEDKPRLSKAKGKAKAKWKPTTTRRAFRPDGQAQEPDDDMDLTTNKDTTTGTASTSASRKGKGKAKAKANKLTVVRMEEVAENSDNSGDDDDDHDDAVDIANQIATESGMAEASKKKRGRPSKAANFQVVQKQDLSTKAAKETSTQDYQDQPVRKRGRPSKAANSQVVQKQDLSTKAAKETSTQDDQDQPVRKRGRPSKGAPPTPTAGATSSSAAGSSPLKRKRGVTAKEGAIDNPRRSTRAAAETANIQMAEQSGKRQKVVPTITAAPKRKGTATARPGRKSKPSNVEYEVEKVLKSRMNKKTNDTEYLVKWKGWASSDNTWEPADNLAHCPKPLAQFKSTQPTK